MEQDLEKPLNLLGTKMFLNRVFLAYSNMKFQAEQIGNIKTGENVTLKLVPLPDCTTNVTLLHKDPRAG